jgi:UDP-N-acetylmuramoyl-tripeptide--D-alanyl-D-alanine ligase
LDKSKKTQSTVTIPVVGKHFVSNALAAAGVAKALKLPLQTIKKGLGNFSPPKHRMKFINHKSGALIIDDSYNNNPQAAIETLKTFDMIIKDKRRIVVFGDMLELGKHDVKYHRKLGRILGKSGLEKLICVGKSSSETASEAEKLMSAKDVEHVNNWKDSVTLVKPYLTEGNAILIKGSRSIGLDRLVSKLV